jgi:hypothetical protein
MGLSDGRQNALNWQVSHCVGCVSLEIGFLGRHIYIGLGC